MSLCEIFLAAESHKVRTNQHQNVNIVKTRLVFQTVDPSAEIPSGGFNDRFIDAECIDHSCIFECRIRF